MIFIIIVSLYTSRVVLNTLGIEDYGIYNVVGGFVSMFGFLNTAMSAATQRYITFCLGKGDADELKKVFFNCVLTHALICVIVLLFAETVGLWFLYNKMIIPPDRLSTAFWVFQCSIMSTIILIMSVPYNADIIAHEKMSAFAYISIAEVTLKLLIVYILGIGELDKLLTYAILMVVVQGAIQTLYRIYCRRHFEESKLSFIYDSKLLKEMLSFAGWNIWGGVSNILYTHGINLLLNLFFGPAVNAARGVAVQVQNAISQFAHGFQMAINPQITKAYAQGQLYEMHKLVFRSSKFTFMLLLILSLPIYVETEFILTLWLKTVPDWTISFLRLMLCIIIVDAVANPFMVSVAATGRVKFYQSVIGGTMILIVPVAYITLKLGASPTAVFYTHLGFALITFLIRLFIVRPMIKFKIADYLKVCVLRIIIITIPSVGIVAYLKQFLNTEPMGSLCMICLSVIVVVIFSYLFGLTSKERKMINCKIMLVLNKKK
jgi:O-antigen/teichoic acid export membrane protein